MKVIILGATGMVGKGVLLECLNNAKVTTVLVVNRKPVGISHDKLKEIIHKDFFNLEAIKNCLAGYDACYFCLGISAFRQSEANYKRITYDLTLHFAETLLVQNQNMTFIYVSGKGTDSTEKGKTMWARVKGKTENAILALGFKDAYTLRPAYIKPDKNAPSSTPLYRILLSALGWLHPLIKVMFPSFTTTTFQIGRAMLYITENPTDKKQIESKDINVFSAKLEL